MEVNTVSLPWHTHSCVHTGGRASDPRLHRDIILLIYFCNFSGEALTSPDATQGKAAQQAFTLKDSSRSLANKPCENASQSCVQAQRGLTGLEPVFPARQRSSNRAFQKLLNVFMYSEQNWRSQQQRRMDACHLSFNPTWWNRILKCDKWTISVDEINLHNFLLLN